mmetsp:Transcript_18228/g.35658  ORF Transcript_18228/g.35658 Transcript_18228/m.35658 type:complete len:584 (+) Transcript_18228:530-2281(+)
MAAAAYRVRTRRFGAFVIMFCFPGAYVEIDDDHPSFRMLPPISKLKITAAGIWHNVVLCTVVGIALVLMPVLNHICYNFGDGILITQVHDRSFLKAVQPYSHFITGLDNQPVSSQNEWTDALLRTTDPTYRTGWCVAQASTPTVDTFTSVDPFRDCCAFLRQSYHPARPRQSSHSIRDRLSPLLQKQSPQLPIPPPQVPTYKYTTRNKGQAQWQGPKKPNKHSWEQCFHHSYDLPTNYYCARAKTHIVAQVQVGTPGVLPSKCLNNAHCAVGQVCTHIHLPFRQTLFVLSIAPTANPSSRVILSQTGSQRFWSQRSEPSFSTRPSVTRQPLNPRVDVIQGVRQRFSKRHLSSTKDSSSTAVSDERKVRSMASSRIAEKQPVSRHSSVLLHIGINEKNQSNSGFENSTSLVSIDTFSSQDYRNTSVRANYRDSSSASDESREGTTSTRGHSGIDQLIFYVGHPDQLQKAVSTSDYRVRSSVEWILSFGHPDPSSGWQELLRSLPGLFDTSFRYIVAVSSSLAVINAAPLYYVDGAYNVYWLLVMLSSVIKIGHKEKWAERILATGSVLFAVNMGAVVLSYFNLS